jgi:O-antigen/teichoic acid export membrane protein
MVGTEAVAYYGAAYRFLGLMVFIPHAIIMVFLPSLARSYHDDKAEFARLYTKVFYALMLIGIPAATWVMFYADPIISVIYSSSYRPSIIVLKILVWAGAAIFSSHLFGYVLVCVNRQNFGIIISIIALVCNVLMNLFLIPRVGIVGAAIATVVTELLIAICCLAIVIYYEKIHPFSMQLINVLLLAIGTGLVATMLKTLDWKLSSLLYFTMLSTLSMVTLKHINNEFKMSH